MTATSELVISPTPNSRSYITHFTQPDSIVPDPNNSQAWDRYAYSLNNPVRYTDPSGHIACNDNGNGECKPYTRADQIKDLKLIIKQQFRWNVKGNDWTLKELETIYQVGLDIETNVDSLTGGKGNQWMMYTLGNTTLVHGDCGGGGCAQTWPGLFGATIKLDENWLTQGWDPYEKLAHEFGHVYDINTGNYTGFGGGPADDLVVAMGGNPYLSLCRFCTGEPDPNNPPGLWNAHGGYGNESVNDYFAEAFAWSVYGGLMPPGVNDWMVDWITYEGTFLP